MESNGYNGWQGRDGSVASARATWNLALWVDNEYAIYRAKVAWLFELSEAPDGEACEAFARDHFDGSTPDGDDLDLVCWDEIAESWAVEYRYFGGA